MKKNDLISEVMNQAKTSRFDTEMIINYALDIISDRLVKGEKVYLSGFGTFEVHERAAHKASNPRTGESIMIDGYKAPVFKASVSLKEKVNK